MSTCLACINWTGAGVPRWAFKLGMACCALKNTRAVTLPHWAACPSWRGTHQEQIAQRSAWLARCGVVVDNKGA